ncbi:hypothetical protein Q9L58_004070 [Maublancomyces gigas]|uniref:F-box domain-containing protein n=1 Tax=Discina gigas TaxID=1032678 RepID=A0ABR3GM16_9PEZI
MTVLDDLPNEAFLNIFSYLASPDLASTSLVSRRWHVISEPVLYREPDIDRDPDIDRGPDASDLSRWPGGIGLFLRTLLTPGRERLAFHVRAIYLNWSNNIPDPTPRRRGNLTLIEAAESCYGVTRSSVLGSLDSQVVLLMHMLPRLHRLHVMPAQDCDSFNDLLDTIGPTNPLPLSFQALTYFFCDWSFTKTGVSAQATLALLQLPHMKTLLINIQGEWGGDFPTNVGGTSGITNFTLVSEITGVLLAFILSVPRALERFTYVGPWMDEFVCALGLIRSTAIQLVLAFDTQDSEPVHSLSFRNWPVLRELFCPLALLVSCLDRADGRQLAEALPASILQLEISDWVYISRENGGWGDESEEVNFWYKVDLFVQLVGDEIEMVPRLERLIINLEYNQLPEELRAVCEAAGVAVGRYED